MTIRVMGNLKGPYIYVPEGEGHGYLGAVLYDDVKDKVQCHACGEWYKMVNESHVRRCSGQSLIEHKIAYGFPLTTVPLCRPATSETFRKIAKEKIARGQLLPRKKGSKEARQGGREGSQAKREMYGKAGTSRVYTLYRLNERGTCPAQIEEALSQLIEINEGRPPNYHDLPLKVQSVVKSRFGTYNKALRFLGFGDRGHQRQLSIEFLIAELQRAKEVLGRSPTSADIGGEFPSVHTYQNRFGSWSNAKKVAGV